MSSVNRTLGETLKRLIFEEMNTTASPSWEDIAMSFYDHKSEEFHGCKHAIMASILRMRLDEALERAKILEIRMEDLCNEMEEVKNKTQTFVMGPGIINAEELRETLERSTRDSNEEENLDP